MKTKFTLILSLLSLGLANRAPAQTFSDANWISMGAFPGPDGAISAAVVDGSGNLYIAGGFRFVSGVSANRIAKWNGSSWSPLGSGINGPVEALALSGGYLYAGGFFTTAGGSPATNIAKWDGSSWSPLGSGMNDPTPNPSNLPHVLALAVSGSDLYVGGAFRTAGGSPAKNIAKWNGSSWTALGSGMNYYVWALAISGNDLYAGGGFTAAGGIPATNIAKWNGSTWSPLGSGVTLSPVYALAVAGSDLYAGGNFTTAGGSPANYIAKWDGSSWTPLGSGIGGSPYNLSVIDLAVSGTDLYVGGYFTTAGGNPANNIAKWNGSSWSPLGSGLNYGAVALAVSGNELYAGGYFTTAGGKSSPYLARAIIDPPGYNHLTGKALFSDVMVFSYIGEPAVNYALDRTVSLAPPINWVGQKTNTMTISGVLTFTNTPVPGTNNFWRVRSVP